MASSPKSFVFITMAVLLQLLLVSASSLTTTKYINAICERVKDKAFCVQTLNAYSPAASATDKFQAAHAALSLGKSYALKSASFIEKAAKERPNLKKQFKACQNAFVYIVMNFRSAAGELRVDPLTANYDIMVSYDSTTIVKNLVGKNRDMASKMVMKMVLKMERLIAIAVGATESVGG